METLELKEGKILQYKQKTYMILGIDEGDDKNLLLLDLIPVNCQDPTCQGNIEKFGSTKNQYKCIKCGTPVWIDGKGERII